jgi:REP element-mobilizing transposase RayT
MARALRTIIPGLTYHVYSRCIEKKALLFSRKAAYLMEQVLIDTLEKYNFELISYQIMDNHFHFIIRTLEGEASISRIMQYIKARYAERYNKMNNRTGPFWNERFKDQVLEFSDNPLLYLIWLICYLAYNPVVKGLVNDPRDWPHGSFNAHLDPDYESRVKITVHEYMRAFGDTFEQQREQLLYYEELYRRRIAFVYGI